LVRCLISVKLPKANSRPYITVVAEDVVVIAVAATVMVTAAKVVAVAIADADYTDNARFGEHITK
jgi:hypothetical protein